MPQPVIPNLQCWQTWCFGSSEEGVMREKLVLAIVITFSLSCIHNWSEPAATRLKTSSQIEVPHLAALWLDSLP